MPSASSNYSKSFFSSFPTALIGAASVASLGIAIYNLRILEQIAWNRSNIISLIVLPLLASICLTYLLTQTRAIKLGATFSLVSIILSLYVVEATLTFCGLELFLPSSFDKRSRAEVVKDLRATGIPTYPVLSPWIFLQHPVCLASTHVMPLSGIANVQTVFCNELGPYYNYMSDANGFNNPQSVWSRDTLDLLLLGDSFVHGMCVSDGGVFAEQLRTHSPALLNLGFNGSGQLSEYAAFKEYGQSFKPKNVIWFFYEGNDAVDLSKELQDPILRSYLENSNYSQNLKEQKLQIDTALKSIVEQKIQEEFPSTLHEYLSYWKSFTKTNFLPFLKLYSLRTVLGLVDVRKDWPREYWLETPGINIKLTKALKEILQTAREQINVWNGNLIFVYLPSHRGFARSITHPWREEVLSTVRESGIPIIDMLEVFQSSGDPLQFFPNRANGHYNLQGNTLVADSIIHFIGLEKGHSNFN